MNNQTESTTNQQTALVITFPGDVLVATVSGHRTPDDTLYYAELMTELYGILGGKQA